MVGGLNSDKPNSPSTTLFPGLTLTRKRDKCVKATRLRFWPVKPKQSAAWPAYMSLDGFNSSRFSKGVGAQTGRVGSDRERAAHDTALH